MKPIEVDQFTRFNYLSSLSISDDKQTLYFIKTVIKDGEYRQQLISMNVNDRKQTPLTDLRDSVRYIMLDGKLILLDREKECKTVHTAFRELKDGKFTETMRLPLSIRNIESLNSRYYLVTASTNRAHPYYYSLDQKQQEAIEQEKKDNADYIVLDEYPFFFNGSGFINGNRTAMFLVNKKTLKIEKIGEDSYDVGSFTVYRNRIIFAVNDFDTLKMPYSKICQYDLKTKEIKVLVDEKIGVRRIFTDNNRVIVYASYGKDYGFTEAPKYYQLTDDGLKLLIDTELSFHNAVGCDARFGSFKSYLKDDDRNYFTMTDGYNCNLVVLDKNQFVQLTDVKGSVDDFVIGTDSIYFIGTLKQNLSEIYQLKDGKLTKLTRANSNSLKGYYVATPEKVTVKKVLDIDGWVLKPINYDPTKKYPAILDIHGGPKSAYGEVFFHEMQYWASLGFFVMYCNPRGSDGKGNRFADLRKQWGGIDYEDIMDFVDKVLETYPAIDAERLGVTGGSYGGFMTNWIIGQTDRFKAAATQRSISNWITEFLISDYGVDFPIEMQFADINNCWDDLWAMSPLKYVNNVKTPTLFIHSIEDYRCPVPEGLQLYTALKLRNVESRMVLFKGENHDLSRSGKPAHRIRRLNEITGWMQSHLQKG